VDAGVVVKLNYKRQYTSTMKKSQVKELVKEALKTYAVTRDNEKDLERELGTDLEPGEKVTAEDLDIGHVDDEPGMIKQEVYDIAQYAAKLYKLLKHYEDMPVEVDFPHWWQSKIVKAKAMLSKAQHYLEFETMEPEIDMQMTEGAEEVMDAYKPRFVKDKNNPNFLNVYINYDLGPGGSSIALGKETMTGQIRRESAAKAMQLANKVAKDLEAKYNLEDIDVEDRKNGTVAIFAVSDDFTNMQEKDFHIKESVNEIDSQNLALYSKKDLLQAVKELSKMRADAASKGQEILVAIANRDIERIHKELKRKQSSEDKLASLKLEEGDQDWVDQAIKDYEEMQANKDTRNDDDLEAGIE